MSTAKITTRHDSFTRVSRALIERSMELRCQAYMANAKHKLLIKTIMEMDHSKRSLVENAQHFEELDRIKTIFIAGLSHELGNPLSVIMMFTSLIMNGTAGPLTDKQQHYLKNVISSAEHLKAILSDTLDMAKIEAHTLEPRYTSFSLQELIDEAVYLLRHSALEKGINIRVEHAGKIVLLSDRRRLLQCLINIITNAIKYTEDGTIIIASSQKEQYVSIAVADSGIGMSDEDIHNLYTIFHRGTSAKRSMSQGNGIGLYLTNKLIHDILQGSISVESQLNKGSTFTINLPVAVDTQLNGLWS